MKPRPKISVTQTVPAPAPEPRKEPWWRSPLTDHNGDFDLGAILVGVVILAMCYYEWYDVTVNHIKFDAQQFGIGVGSVLLGFAGYKWGDTKRPPGTTTTTATLP